MQKDDHIRLRHMLDAAREAEIFIQSKTRDSLETDRKLVFALIKCIEIVGEAAANVTNQCRDNSPQIPWPSIISMRNRLIHAYFDIDLDVLWKTLIEDIPSLIVELEKIVDERS